MKRGRGTGRSTGPGRRLGLFLLAAAALALGALAWLRVGPPASIEIDPELPGIGPRTPIAVRLSEPRRGLSGVEVELLQGERVELLAERSYRPRPFWAFWGPRVESDELVLEVGGDEIAGLESGEATIRVSAARAPTWLRRPDPAVRELTLPVRLEPPALRVVSRQNYVAQGGSGAVVYAVDDDAARHGVSVAGDFFAGDPLPGGASDERFALYGVPHDLDQEGEIRLVAADALGNQATARFLDRFFPRPLRTDVIRLDDRFMERVVPAIQSRTPELDKSGDLLADYLTINRDLRRSNAETLERLAERSRREFLWSEAFLQLPNTQAMASFADRRTYLYDGREVDRQDHLGFDLASVRRAPVEASNRGVVMMAEYFGIYGNTVVLDHGYGLMSLYAHLSSFEVEPGQTVERGAVLGRTGETGLAGGDHLHFSILLGGLPVDPIEWWDEKWIRDRVADKLGPALEVKRQ